MNAKVMQYERHGNAVLNAVPDLDSKIKHIKAASKKMDIGKNMFTFQFLAGFFIEKFRLID